MANKKKKTVHDKTKAYLKEFFSTTATLAYLKEEFNKPKVSDQDAYLLALNYEITLTYSYINFFKLTHNYQFSFLIFRRLLELIALNSHFDELEDINFRLLKLLLYDRPIGKNEDLKYKKELHLKSKTSLKKHLEQFPLYCFAGIISDDFSYYNLIQITSHELINNYQTLSLLSHQHILFYQYLNITKQNYLSNTFKVFDNTFNNKLKKSHNKINKDNKYINEIDCFNSKLYETSNDINNEEYYRNAFYQISNCGLGKINIFHSDLINLIEEFLSVMNDALSFKAYSLNLFVLRTFFEYISPLIYLLDIKEQNDIFVLYKNISYLNISLSKKDLDESSYDLYLNKLYLDYLKINNNQINISYDLFKTNVLSNPTYVIYNKKINYSTSITYLLKQLNEANYNKYYALYDDIVKLSHVNLLSIRLDQNDLINKLNIYKEFINELIDLIISKLLLSYNLDKQTYVLEIKKHFKTRINLFNEYLNESIKE